MSRTGLIALAILGAAWAGGPSTRADDPPAADSLPIPEAFRPFEHVVGPWKGMAIPQANRIKGWPERHLWAWTFQDGKPVGMALAIEGGKTLASARLEFDPEARRYVLATTATDKSTATFEGALDAKGQTLTLEPRDPPAGKPIERWVLRLNSNGIRYTWTQERKEPGSPRFVKAVEANLGKEGESFAAGGNETALPKCIITGGAATMTVSHAGKSYPICCSGCRDEFLADPEKYVRKLAAMGNAAATETPTPAKEPASKDSVPAGKATTREEPRPAGEPATKKADPTANPDARAQRYLDLAQGLEKSGKSAAALSYYRRVIKEFPGSPAAARAAARITALGGK